ncbi:hypothetical protein LTR36_006833 [Oleoguttula mirabilis]|uniref:Uncharacterized protein n=1 Tax=Oleoguttula mirabilis TaxID=1507867 RepID=A0AAV9JC82_9PEZI|nr:hypothetical protein LTR36_006833 [Oleoguttula mirabilis]
MDSLLCKYNITDDQHPFRWLPEDSVIAYVYENTSEFSPIRHFLVSVCTWASTPELLTQTPNRLHADFLLELAAHLLGNHVETRQSLDIPAEVKSCDFHVHAEGVECATRKRKRETEQAGQAGQAEQPQRALPRTATAPTSFPPPSTTNVLPTPSQGFPLPPPQGSTRPQPPQGLRQHPLGWYTPGLLPGSQQAINPHPQPQQALPPLPPPNPFLNFQPHAPPQRPQDLPGPQHLNALPQPTTTATTAFTQ